MERLKVYLCAFLGGMLVAGVLTACGGGGGSGTSPTAGKAQPQSYSTTSSKGDYSEWTLTGDHLDASWNVVATDGSIAYTYTFEASCGAADSTYGTRSCSVTTQSCTDGTAVCPTSGGVASPFTLMAAPGVALFVQTGSDLHVGFAKDASACSEDIAGDYTMMHTGLGVNENFGLFRSDSNFISIAHSDFGFDSAGAMMTPTVAYRSGSGGAATLTDGGCSDGVRTRSVGGETLRAMITHGGLFVVDLPAGQGGLLAFKTGDAASLSDFESKTFGGVSFPDDASPLFVRGDAGAVSGGQVAFHISETSAGGTTTGMLHLQPLTAAATATSPAYPDFTAVPSGYGASPLAGDYANPAAIPGLFKISDPFDAGRVILAATKFNGKVIAVGMVYNYRTTMNMNPATGMSFPMNGLYNTGNFILFEM